MGNQEVRSQKSEVAKIYSGGHRTLFVRLEIESLDKRSCQKFFLTSDFLFLTSSEATVNLLPRV